MGIESDTLHCSCVCPSSPGYWHFLITASLTNTNILKKVSSINILDI